VSLKPVQNTEKAECKKALERPKYCRPQSWGQGHILQEGGRLEEPTGQCLVTSPPHQSKLWDGMENSCIFFLTPLSSSNSKKKMAIKMCHWMSNQRGLQFIAWRQDKDRYPPLASSGHPEE
jgi:hypothetical protein